MPSQSTTNYGLKYGWTLGENGWNTEMDDNFLALDNALKTLGDLLIKNTNMLESKKLDKDGGVIAGDLSLLGGLNLGGNFVVYKNPATGNLDFCPVLDPLRIFAKTETTASDFAAGTLTGLTAKPEGSLVFLPGDSSKTEDFEDDNWAFTFTGDWIRSTSAKKSGNYSYTNKDIGDNQSSQTSITITLSQAGTVAFDYYVSSESNYDKLIFSIDGTDKLTQGDCGSNSSSSWKSASFPLTSGTHTLTWKYSKDGSNSNGLDSAFIDNLTITGFYSATSGTRVSPAYSLASVGVGGFSSLSWTANNPSGTTLTVETSLDGGQTYQTVTNGGVIPGIYGTDLTGKSLIVKQTLGSTDSSKLVELYDLNIKIYPQYSPVISLTTDGKFLVKGQDALLESIHWPLNNPPDNYCSFPVMFRSSGDLKEIILMFDPPPADPVTVNILKNKSLVATATSVQQITPVTGVTFISGDIIQAQLTGSGITLGAIQLTIK